MKTKQYTDDILSRLLHKDGCPSITRLIEEMNNALKQNIAKAADEIIKLRGEVKKLKRENKILKGLKNASV